MRVLVVTNMYPTDQCPTFGIFVAREVEALRRAGAEVVVESVSGPRGVWDYLLARRRIRTRMRQHLPDIIHTHFGYTLLSTAGLGRPLVVTMYGDDINGTSDGRGGRRWKSRVGVGLSRTLAYACDQVIVQSERMRTRLGRGLNARSLVLPSGVDDALFTPGPQAPARRRLGLDPEALVLAFVNSGRQPTKRLDLAQATCDELRRRGRNAHLLILENVPGDAMPDRYRAADCLLMTSDLEGSPNCVKEALSTGLPVVSVPVGDVPDLVDRPERGCIVPREVGALADGVECTIAVQRAPGQSLLPSERRASRVAERLLELYARLTARDRPPPQSHPVSNRSQPTA